MVVPDTINDDDGRRFTTLTRVVLVTCGTGTLINASFRHIILTFQ